MTNWCGDCNAQLPDPPDHDCDRRKAKLLAKFADVEGRLAKIRWRQSLAKRGQERKEDVSPKLSEALRDEIRTALEAGGAPFDVNVARRVYDLAIAARDLCVAVAPATVGEAIKQIADTNGPMETLDAPGTPEAVALASETFGARILREILAVWRPAPTTETARTDGTEAIALVHAIASARERGMLDVAAALEERLCGRALTGAPTATVSASARGAQVTRVESVIDATSADYAQCPTCASALPKALGTGPAPCRDAWHDRTAMEIAP